MRNFCKFASKHPRLCKSILFGSIILSTLQAGESKSYATETKDTSYCDNFFEKTAPSLSTKEIELMKNGLSPTYENGKKEFKVHFWQEDKGGGCRL